MRAAAYVFALAIAGSANADGVAPLAGALAGFTQAAQSRNAENVVSRPTRPA